VGDLLVVRCERCNETSGSIKGLIMEELSSVFRLDFYWKLI
jgi:hypothetical protein